MTSVGFEHATSYRTITCLLSHAHLAKTLEIIFLSIDRHVLHGHGFWSSHFSAVKPNPCWGKVIGKSPIGLSHPFLFLSLCFLSSDLSFLFGCVSRKLVVFFFIRTKLPTPTSYYYFFDNILPNDFGHVLISIPLISVFFLYYQTTNDKSFPKLYITS